MSFDYQRILYSDVNAIGNTGPVPTELGPAPPCASCLLGMDEGMGFGWDDINVYRLGVEYQYSPNWIFRGGLSWNDQPINESEVLFNILAPAVIQQHVTAGFTYMPNRSSEWNLAVMHAFEEEVSTSLTPFGLPASIKMYENSIDLSYSMLF